LDRRYIDTTTNAIAATTGKARIMILAMITEDFGRDSTSGDIVGESY
jgi:hypothetical protein